MRRNTHKPAPDGGGEVFDATIEVPVTIRDPDKPIGTHVFTAMARNDAGLRWTAVTIDDGDDAKDALDRITIPQDVLDRIAPTALPRSSIIISDEPLSGETNYRTEFVAVLSNQPQGGFITRARTPATDFMADDPSWGGGGFFFPGSFQPQRSPAPQAGNTQAPQAGNRRPLGGPNERPVQQRWLVRRGTLRAVTGYPRRLAASKLTTVAISCSLRRLAGLSHGPPRENPAPHGRRKVLFGTCCRISDRLRRS